MKKAILILPLFGLVACAYPTSTVEQRTPSAHIRLSKAPLGATVSVDGSVVGYRSEDKVDIVDVAPGRHLVQVSSGGQVLSAKEYFFGPGSTVDLEAP